MEMATTQKEATLEELAALAQAYSYNAAVNLFNLAEVLCRARPMVPTGRWGEWVRTNAHISERRAQEWMQAWRKMGGRPEYAALGPSKVLSMLTMDDGDREKFMEEHDVAGMSVRELRAKIREELRGEAMEEARQIAFDELGEQLADAERRAKDAEKRAALSEMDPEIPDEVVEELEEARSAASHFGELASAAKSAQAGAEREARRLQAALDDSEEIVSQQQEEINRLQEKLLAMQSEKARGDAAERSGSDLTGDDFADAVRVFVGACARVPYMAGAFAVMPTAEKNQWRELLETVVGWCDGARRALNAVEGEGGVTIA